MTQDDISWQWIKKKGIHGFVAGFTMQPTGGNAAVNFCFCCCKQGHKHADLLQLCCNLRDYPLESLIYKAQQLSCYLFKQLNYIDLANKKIQFIICHRPNREGPKSAIPPSLWTRSFGLPFKAYNSREILLMICKNA